MEPEGSLLYSQVSATVPILSQLELVCSPTSHFLKIHLTIILQSMPRSLSLRFSHQNPVYTSPLSRMYVCMSVCTTDPNN